VVQSKLNINLMNCMGIEITPKNIGHHSAAIRLTIQSISLMPLFIFYQVINPIIITIKKVLCN